MFVFAGDLQLCYCNRILSSHQSLHLDVSGRNQPLLEDGEGLCSRQEISDIYHARMGYLTSKLCYVNLLSVGFFFFN